MNKVDEKWSPSATVDVLKQRALLYQIIRAFFAERQVLEVEVPVLSLAATTDPYIDSLHTSVMGQRYYLQTSPEFFLKRLLAAGCGDIYSLTKAFRQGELGIRHQPEFTLLEWYRITWDEHQLMDELVALIRQITGTELAVSKWTYRDVFLQYLSVDPHQMSERDLAELAQAYVAVDADNMTRDAWLDILITHCIEPSLPEHLVLIYDYPASQAALAQVKQDQQGVAVARRFELYWQCMELANGYFELCDAEIQRQRFQQDTKQRLAMNIDVPPYDHALVLALQHGLPECSGVALGIDRLLMLLTGVSSIDRVMSFAHRVE